ncbi:MAG: nuclear transport factor 2 family protein [Thermoanaerobaculia bacterium]
MKRTLISALLLLPIASSLFAADDPEIAAIKAVVDQAYVHGVHIDRDAAKMRAGMHESFVMFVQGESGVSQLTRDAWIERMAKQGTAAATAAKPEIRADISVLDHTGNAAVVKVDLFRDGKQIFTDYISLYRFDDGWKLVAKIFAKH